MIDEPLLGGSLGISFSLAGLSQLRQYYETMERVLEETGNWQLAGLEKRAQGLTPAGQRSFLAAYHPRDWLSAFPSELRASIVISAMSFLESQLWQISLSAQHFSQVPFERPKEKILSKYRAYLRKFGRLKLEGNDVWDVLNQYYRLRNILVHNGMYLGHQDNSEELRVIRNRVVGLGIDGDGFYQIEKDLCADLFNQIEDYLQDVSDEVARVWESEQ